MPEHTVREVSKTVREYFDEINKSKFIFDVVSVEFNKEEELWEISCEVSNVFDEEPRSYTITVDEESGGILDVHEEEEEVARLILIDSSPLLLLLVGAYDENLIGGFRGASFIGHPENP